MTHESSRALKHNSVTPRAVALYQILILLALWNSGYKGARVVNTLYALELGARPWDTGLLLSTYGICPLLFAVYAGRVSDRYGVHRPLMGGLVFTALGVVLPFFWPAFPMLFVGAAVSSAGFIFVQVSMQSLTGSLGTGEARTRNINSYALIGSMADLIGPVLAGFLIDHTGHVRTYLFLALFNVGAVIVLGWLWNRLPGASSLDRARRRMIDLVRNPQLRRIIIASAVLITGLDLFQLYMPLYGHSIGLSASAIGMTLGAFAAAGLLTRALIPLLVRRYSEQTIMLHSLLLAAATFVIIPFFEHPVVLGAVCFVLGIGMGFGQPLSVILTYNISPPGRAGEALGLRIAINNSMHIVAPSAFGAIGSLVGLAPVFWATALFLAVGAKLTVRPGER
ncbi:MAG TPA: MFS transporter [Burkholderiales bacterium]|nr:MFS transporter [Burkholderiales bacterium]